MWRIRRFINSIKNLIRWFPTIWKDKDWDGEFTLDLLYFKIKNIRDYTVRRKFYEGWENDVKWMNTCLRLIEVHKDAWGMEDEPVVSLNGTLSCHKRLIDSNIKYSNRDIYEHKTERLFWIILSYKNKFWWD